MTTVQAGGLLTDAEFFSRLIETIIDGLVVQNHHGEIVWSNAAAQRLFDVPGDTLRGRSSRDVRCRPIHLDGSSYAGDQHPSMVSLRTGVPQRHEVVGIHTPAGQLRWIEVNCALFRLPDGPGVASVLTDVTAARAAEAGLQNALHTLQRGLLPTRAPRIHDLDVAVRYQSAGPILMVGGDFYGTLPVDDRRHAFFIGDVCGRGVEAASLTALARHTLHAAGRHLDQPDDVLRWLHDAIAAEDRGTFCTGVFGFVEREPGRALVSMALGGHPQPILLRADGSKSLVGAYGQLLGILDQWDAPVTRLTMEPGDQLVLYTDGLIDTPRPRLTDEALLAAVQRRQTADDTADQVLSIGAPTDACPADDTAVMVFGIAA